jgi:hypothetical protein
MNRDRTQPDNQAELVGMLVNRLERISADSYWAHRASGIRGALLEAQAALGQGEGGNQDSLQALIKYGFTLLERAAREKRTRSK